MSFTYYLPGIIFGLVVLAALVWVVLLIRDIILAGKGKAVCIHCRAAASKISTHEYLFLIPVFFGDKYDDEENYLPTHMTPIRGKDQIPSGQRACRVEVYLCPRCDKKQVHITDILMVRGEEYTKGAYVFAYEPFSRLIADWDYLYNSLY